MYIRNLEYSLKNQILESIANFMKLTEKYLLHNLLFEGKQ